MVACRRLVLIILAPALGCGAPSGSNAEKIGWTSEPAVVCAGGSIVQGIDVSEYQNTVDWTQVHASGRGFAIARVSDGTGHPDPTFATNWSGIKAAGMVRGVYQYFEPSEDPTAQANLLLNAIGTLASNDLAPVADVEVSGGVSGAQLVANLATWIAVIKNATGREPLIYTAPGFWNGLPNTAQFSNVVLWVANWQVSCPDTPSPWSGWSFWQYSDTGSVPGISGKVDLDEFNGSPTTLGQPTVTPDWGARYVSQSFPLATTALQMTAGQTTASYIELQNVGGKAWDSNTHLGTTEPRDRMSVFADSTWLSPNRPAGVTGTVPPGGTYKFQFNLHAPSSAGTYDEYFGVVQEGIAWFSDPGQLGPPDNDLEAQIQIVAGSASDAGSGILLEGGARADAGMSQVASDGSASPPGAGDASAGRASTGASDAGEGGSAEGGVSFRVDGGPSNPGSAAGHRPGGCGCTLPSGKPTAPWMLAVAAFVLVRLSRRRSGGVLLGGAALLLGACSSAASKHGSAPLPDAGGLPSDAHASPSDSSSQSPADAAGESTSPEAASVGSDAGLDAAPDSAPDVRTVVDAMAPLDGGLTLGLPSQASVSDALGAALSSYHRNASTGDIWCTPCDGAPVMLAAAAYTGNTSVDARLLEQMRLLLSNGNDPFATGGYSANDERNATAMYAIAKKTPRIWSQLTAAEIHKIDLMMEATLVADIYATADKTNANGAPVTFDGSTNSNRDWNPNYREGMIGAVLVGTEYFGGKAPTESFLAAYDHAAFTMELQANGLSNAYWTFSTYQTDASAGAPSPQAVQQGIVGYSMHGITLGQLLDMYVYLAEDTFSATVGCGLNGGAGILVGKVYAGHLVSGCAGLPNLGATGMEKEFDSNDAMGARSDASYARLGLRADLFNQLVLVIYGDWNDMTASTAALKLVGNGVTDFFYKATQGYEDYSHGTDEGLFQCGSSMDCPLNQAIWTELLAPAHGL